MKEHYRTVYECIYFHLTMTRRHLNGQLDLTKKTEKLPNNENKCKSHPSIYRNEINRVYFGFYVVSLYIIYTGNRMQRFYFFFICLVLKKLKNG